MRNFFDISLIVRTYRKQQFKSDFFFISFRPSTNQTVIFSDCCIILNGKLYPDKRNRQHVEIRRHWRRILGRKSVEPTRSQRESKCLFLISRFLIPLAILFLYHMERICQKRTHTHTKIVICMFAKIHSIQANVRCFFFYHTHGIKNNYKLFLDHFCLFRTYVHL